PATGGLEESYAGFPLQRGELLGHRGRAVGQRIGHGGDSAPPRELAQQPQPPKVQHHGLHKASDFLHIIMLIPPLDLMNRALNHWSHDWHHARQVRLPVTTTTAPLAVLRARLRMREATERALGLLILLAAAAWVIYNFVDEPKQ